MFYVYKYRIKREVKIYWSLKKMIFQKIKLILKISYFFVLKYKCNNCNSNLRKFLSLKAVLPNENFDLFINGRTYDSKNFETFNQSEFFCPICSIPDKGRFIIKYLETLKNLNNLSVLHISPEIGIQKKLNFLLSDDLYTASYLEDPSTPQIDIQESIPGKFDIIIVSHVLEHVLHDRLALSNLYDACKPGGRVLFLVPIHKEIYSTFEDSKIVDPADRKLAYGLEDHVRQYGKNDFMKLIKEFFELEQFKVLGLDYKKNGIADDSTLYIGIKPHAKK